MTGENRGGFGIVIGHGRWFRRWRETLPTWFEEMTVVIRIIRISLASQIFGAVRGAFIKKVVLYIFGGWQTIFKLGMLGS